MKHNILSDDEKQQLYDEYKNSTKSMRELSIKYNVSEKTIYNIRAKIENKTKVPKHNIQPGKFMRPRSAGEIRRKLHEESYKKKRIIDNLDDRYKNLDKFIKDII